MDYTCQTYTRADLVSVWIGVKLGRDAARLRQVTMNQMPCL
jgi:hypothetical protein